MGISVERTYDEQLITKFIVPLFDDIAEDGTDFSVLDNYVHTDKDLWLAVLKDGQILGVVQFNPYNRSMIEVHPFIDKQHRRHSESAIRAALEYVDKYAPEMYKSIITNIPASKRYATLFARKMGFKEIGRYKGGFFKNDKYDDMVLYQRERKDG